LKEYIVSPKTPYCINDKYLQGVSRIICSGTSFRWDVNGILCKSAAFEI